MHKTVRSVGVVVMKWRGAERKMRCFLNDGLTEIPDGTTGV